MRPEEPATQTPTRDYVVLAFKLSHLQQSVNILHFHPFAFFCQAFRLNRADPTNAVAVGSLFSHASVLNPGHILDQPVCILGRDPTTPVRLRVTLLTTPEGPVETWTADVVASQKLLLYVPAVEPWIPTPLEHTLLNRMPV